MSAAVQENARRAVPVGANRAAWLPSQGIGNELDSPAWVPVLEISGPVAVGLLHALGAAEVPAFASPTRPPDTWRLWVATARYLTAEQILLRVMPGLLDRYPDGLR